MKGSQLHRLRHFPQRGLSSFALLFLGPLLLPATSNAAGFDFPDLGTVALGRGGAFVARADSPLALIYNPAGAARLRGTQFLVNVSLLKEETSFLRRQYHGDTAPYLYPDPGPVPGNTTLNDKMPLVENQEGFFPNPLLLITSDLGILHHVNMVLLAGVYGPNGTPGRKYGRWCKPGSDPCEPADSGYAAPQRYSAVSSDSIVVYPSIGLAWQPLPQLRIGGVVQFSYAHVKYQTVIGAFVGEDPEQDIDVSVNVDSPVTPTGIVGLHFSPFRFLEFGASVRFGMIFKNSGELCVGDRQPDGSCTLPAGVAGTMPIETKPASPSPASVDVPFPWVIRTGLRYIDRDQLDRERFDLELNYVWEGTSRVTAFRLIPAEQLKIYHSETDQYLGFTIKGVRLDRAWKDTWSLRWGGSYRLHDMFLKDSELIFRAGGFYEPEVGPWAYTSPDYLLLDRLAYTLGIGYRWGRYEFNVAFAHIVDQERTVAPPEGVDPCDTQTVENCGSAMKKVVVLKPGTEEKKFGKAVGNGTYNVSIYELSFGLKVSFWGS